MGIIIDTLKGIPINAVLRDRLEKLEKKYEELEAENTQLRSENKELKSQVKEPTGSDELCEDEEKILKLLATHNQLLVAKAIAGELDINLTKTEFYLGRMRRKYVNTPDYGYGDDPLKYELSQKGREYLVKNDFIE